ncbi:hypothetical protein [Aeromonas allosaccharophila]
MGIAISTAIVAQITLRLNGSCGETLDAITKSPFTSKMGRSSTKDSVHNAHYVQLPISHGKTDTQVEIRLLYRVLAHSNPQGRAFAA